MPYYLITAKPYDDTVEELKQRVKKREFMLLQPFGEALTYGLENAKLDELGNWRWEELDYCSPPLKEERAQVLDYYFKILEVLPVDKNSGWQQIAHHPPAM